MTPVNAAAFAQLREVRGLFVGRAALDVEVFIEVSELARAVRAGVQQASAVLMRER